jgi:Mce-associated membrane protein
MATATVPALAVLLAALLAWGGLLVWQLHRASAAASARSDGLAAATELTPRLLTYDYRSLPTDIARAESATTGRFAIDYRDTVARTVALHAADQHLVTRATARRASVVSASSDELVALVFLSQVTTSTKLTASRLDNSGVRVRLSRIGGTWLIAALERV